MVFLMCRCEPPSYQISVGISVHYIPCYHQEWDYAVNVGSSLKHLGFARAEGGTTIKAIPLFKGHEQPGEGFTQLRGVVKVGRMQHKMTGHECIGTWVGGIFRVRTTPVIPPFIISCPGLLVECWVSRGVLEWVHHTHPSSCPDIPKVLH